MSGMFSRISEAFGCPQSKISSADASAASEGAPSWLSQTTTSLFAVPMPTLQEALRKMAISRCSSTGKFFLDEFNSTTTTTTTNRIKSTPWNVVHSSRKRSKEIEPMFISDTTSSSLIEELRKLASTSEENIPAECASFFSLLIPLLPGKPIDELYETNEDDVLLLFGSPPTVFQMLLSVSRLCTSLTDLIMELTSGVSLYSLRLIEQFRQPVGLTSVICSKQAFSDTAARLLQLFQVVSEPIIQAAILTILPELAAAPCSSNTALSDEARNVLVTQLLDLLRTVPIGDCSSAHVQQDPTICLLECLTSFPVNSELAGRVHDACFELLDRCYSDESYHAYLPTILRCLVLDGPALPRTASAEFAKLITRLRTYCVFPKTTMMASDNTLVESALIDLLRRIFQFNHSIATEWMKAINTSGVKDLNGAAADQLITLHDQAVQDFIVLCVMYSATESDTLQDHTVAKLGSSQNFKLTLSTPTSRSQKEVSIVARRLASSGRLFPYKMRSGLLEGFMKRYCPLLLNSGNGLFTAYLNLLDQLISTVTIGSQTSGEAIRELAVDLYVCTFGVPQSTPDQRQAVVGKLVHHGSTALTCVNSRLTQHYAKTTAITRAGLKALTRLAKSHPAELVKFEAILFTLLESLFQSVSQSGATKDHPSIDDQGFSSLREHTRCIFTILAWVAFCDRENKPSQEKLLSLLRRAFSQMCTACKAFGVVGAVMVLETMCRRPKLQCERREDQINPISTQFDDSIVLASQITHVEADRVSISSTTTSRSSTSSRLSLRGPGTGLADDPKEVNMVATQETDEDGTVGITEALPITAPSRLLLQLIGLVEHAIESCVQLQAFWLEELGTSFQRIVQYGKAMEGKISPVAAGTPTNVTNVFQVSSSVQAERLIQWMGARVMRDFQDSFVVDNTAVDGFTIELNLNDLSMSDVVIDIGISWKQHRAQLATRRTTLPQTKTTNSTEKCRRVLSPLLIPVQLGLLATVERVRGGARLEAIDALLGCPLLVPGNGVAPEAPETQLLAFNHCDDEPQLLLFVINWCVEVVNVFAPLILRDDNVDSLCVSSVNSQALDVEHSWPQYRASALARLGQISLLRRQLYQRLDELDKHGKRVELMVTDDLGLPARQSLMDVCLPTHTYEPAKLWNSHPTVKEPNSVGCFKSGLHLATTGSKAVNNTTSRLQSSKAGTSKCAAASTSTRGRRGGGGDCKRGGRGGRAKQPRRDEDCTHMTDSDGDAQRSSDSSEAESMNVDLTISSKLHVEGKTSKMAAGKSKRSKCAKAVSPDLAQLTACFRELDMTSLTLGLSAWPWSDAVDRTKSPIPTEQDWTTLSWLLEDLSCKLNYLSGLRSLSPTGWYAFQRLDNLQPRIRAMLLLHLIPSMHRILQIANDYFTGDTRDSNTANLAFSSSDEESPDNNNQTTGGGGGAAARPQSTQLCVDFTSQTGGMISGIVCNCLHILCSLLVSRGNPNVVVIPTVRLSPPSPLLSPFTVDCLNCLSASCETNTSFVDERSRLRVEGFTGRGMQLKDLFVDLIDSCWSPPEQSSYEPAQLASKLRLILEWLLGMSPNGLPHLTAAYLHSRLVYRLTSMYVDCLVQMNKDSILSQSRDAIWAPDLFSYTKVLLDAEWDPDVQWKSFSYRDSLQGLLSMHFRVGVDLSADLTRCDPLATLSPNFVVDFTRGLLVSTVRRYQDANTSLGDAAGAPNRLSGYKTLSRSTVNVYCREVLETVLWFTHRLCAVDRVANASRGSEPRDCLLLANWNECVTILEMLVNLIRAPSKRRNSDPAEQISDRILLTMIPMMMRTGRLFLQSLLKDAMPLLNTLFRHRGLDVTTFLRNTQSVTRFLQRVCTHAKAYRNSQLTNQIPATRRALETFVYRVKIMLHQHKCADAFWLGTLKTRDLHGVVLKDADSRRTSQTSHASQAISQTASIASTRPSFPGSLPADLLRGSIEGDEDSRSESESVGESRHDSAEREVSDNLTEDEVEDGEAGEESDIIQPSDSEEY